MRSKTGYAIVSVRRKKIVGVGFTKTEAWIHAHHNFGADHKLLRSHIDQYRKVGYSAVKVEISVKESK
jgi:hypothetical protein